VDYPLPVLQRVMLSRRFFRRGPDFLDFFLLFTASGPSWLSFAFGTPPGHLQETLCAPRLIDLVNQFSRLFYYRALAGATAQQSSLQQDLPTLSPAVHAALYSEVKCVHRIVPQWDHGYILHLEIDKDPAMVTMYVSRRMLPRSLFLQLQPQPHTPEGFLRLAEA
jgi:hypothetical protein